MSTEGVLLLAAMRLNFKNSCSHVSEQTRVLKTPISVLPRFTEMDQQRPHVTPPQRKYPGVVCLKVVARLKDMQLVFGYVMKLFYGQKHTKSSECNIHAEQSKTLYSNNHNKYTRAFVARERVAIACAGCRSLCLCRLASSGHVAMFRALETRDNETSTCPFVLPVCMECAYLCRSYPCPGSIAMIPFLHPSRFCASFGSSWCCYKSLRTRSIHLSLGLPRGLLRPLHNRRTLRPLRSLHTRRPLRPLRPLHTRRTLRALRPLHTRRSLRTHSSHASFASHASVASRSDEVCSDKS